MKMLSNIFYYLQGNIRYFLFRFARKLLPKYIQEQFHYRMNSIKKECFFSGSCRNCGCSIPQLQMADKKCSVGCYPEMKTQSDWEEYKLKNNIGCSIIQNSI